MDPSRQIDPSLKRFDDGRFLVTWNKSALVCCSESVAGRIFSADGEPLTAEFSLGSYGGSFRGPGLVMLPGNKFVVATESEGNTPPRWAVHDDTGALVQASMTLPGSQLQESALIGAALDGAGHLVLLDWEVTSNGPPAAWAIRLHRYLQDGTSLGAPIVVVAENTNDEELWPIDVVPASDGSVVVAWLHLDASGMDGYFRRYDSNGAPVGADVLFASPASASTSIDTDGLGHVFVATVQTDYEPLIQRFSLDGSEVVELEMPDADITFLLDLDAAPDGRVAIAWWGQLPDGYYSPPGFVTRFNSNGVAEGPSTPSVDDSANPGRVDDISLSPGGSLLAVRARETQPGQWFAVSVQRFCDTDDPGCSLCPGFDDNLDADGDGMPDDCDICTNVADAQSSITGSAQVTSAGFEVPYARRYNTVRVDETFVLPDGVTFSSLDVASEGMRLRVETRIGQAMLDVSLPGGVYAGRGTAGWLVRPTRIIYRDKTDNPVNGIRRVSISDRSKAQTGAVRVKAGGAGGNYGVWDSYVPMRVIMSLGGSQASADGVCGELSFDETKCNSAYIIGDEFQALARCLGK